MMAKSDSTAGDLAQVIFDRLVILYGRDSVSWEKSDDTIAVEDENGFHHFVKVELN
jgi:hypothetical protein